MLKPKLTQTTIQEFITDSYEEDKVLRVNLNLSSARLCQLKKQGIPALDTAALVYVFYDELLYPYSEEALTYHLALEEYEESLDGQ